MKRIPLFISFFIYIQAQAQVGGKGVYAFLNMPASSRQVALGSNFISVLDNDVSQAWNNPAALNPKMHNHAFATYNNYVSDINSGYFAYGRDFKKLGTFSAGIMYLDYGKFDGFEANGTSTGTFTVKDQCFHVSWGRQWREKFSYGASLKYVYSIYESFVSNGLSTDLSGIYHDTARQLSVTAFARNIGFQAIPFGGTARQNLPFELALSISKKLEHLPFRYNLVFHNLQKPDMRYTIENTGVKDENGDNKIKTMTMGDNILRHITLGGELNISRHFVLRFGYNHMRRKEMTQEQKKGTSGFSWGLGFRISKFHLSYGSAAYFPGVSSNQFSLLMNLGDFYKKK
jgi:hypothetical protein